MKMKMKALESAGWAVACFIVSMCALIVAILAYERAPGWDCPKPGDIRRHGGKACVVERVTIDPDTKILIIDETLLEEL